MRWSAVVGRSALRFGGGRALAALSVGDHEASLPSWRPPPFRRLNRLGIDPAARNNPRDHRVRIPHLAGAELVTPPHRSRNLRDHFEDAASALLLIAEPSRAV